MNKPFRLFKVPSDKPDYYCYCWSDVNGKTVHTYVPKTNFSLALAAHNLGLTAADFPAHVRHGISPILRLLIQNSAGVRRHCLTTVRLQTLRISQLQSKGWVVLSITTVPPNEVF